MGIAINEPYLDPFVGGQAEIQIDTPGGRIVRRGEIQRFECPPQGICIYFTWLAAMGEGGWQEIPADSFLIPMALFGASKPDERLIFSQPNACIVVLYPKSRESRLPRPGTKP